MDSNSWEIVDPVPLPANHENCEKPIENESDSDDREYRRQSSRYGQNVKNYE